MSLDIKSKHTTSAGRVNKPQMWPSRPCASHARLAEWRAAPCVMCSGTSDDQVCMRTPFWPSTAIWRVRCIRTLVLNIGAQGIVLLGSLSYLELGETWT